MILQSAMGERSDRTWAAKRVGISVPRQNGKSQLLVARALAGALLFGERKIVISAHQQDTSRESFGKLLELIEADANGWLRDRIKPGGIMHALNREAIKFRDGATIQFKARSGSGGRGFSSDCLMLDEAQILTERAWVSINSTMSAMPNPQVWLLGTPPTPEDDGAVFGSIRTAASSGKSTATAWLEWAADPSADPELEETRWSANPAWNTRINHEVVQGEFESYPPDRFSLDRLGIWLDDLRISIMPNWSALKASIPDAEPSGLGIAADIDATWLSLGAVLHHDRPHLAVPDGMRVRVSERQWFVSEVARIQRERGCPVAIDKRGPASFLIPDLISENVVLTEYSLDDFIQACADLVDAVASDSVEHDNDPDLNAAVAAAGWRTVGDRRVFGRKTGDISALEAVALALAVSDGGVSYDPLASVL